MFLKKILVSGLVMTGAALSALSASADPFLPVPPASFLNYHVSTARGLSEEVAQDVTVRARLARHFGMSAPAVAAYVRANLVETALSAGQAGRYRVACISPSGREYFVTERLAAGTPVFALAATGQPILRLACGNPLVASLPVVTQRPLKKLKPALLATPSKSFPAMAAAPTPQISDQTFTPAFGFAPPEAAPFVHVAGVTQSLKGKGGAFLPVLFGAAGVGVAAGHHGSSPPAITPPPGTPPTAAVPEPSSLFLFGAFGLVMLGMQAKSRRRD